MMRSGRGPFLISIIVIILLIQMIPETGAKSWDGIYRSSDAKPWKIWYRDPRDIQSMEIDPGNRTLYIGCENGLIIKDLETGAYTVIDQYDGLNPLKAPLVSDIELDLPNERVFFVLESGTEIYELNTISKEISIVHRFDATTTMFKYGRSKALEYDRIHDILYFARDSGLMVFDMKSNEYRFHDFLNFDVRISKYEVIENTVSVIMEEIESNRFAISDIELAQGGERLFIVANTGLFSYIRSNEMISKDINRSDFGRPLQDILFVEETGELLIAGEKVWSFDPLKNSTEIIYEDQIERDREPEDFLKLLWLESNSTLVISSGQGPALIFHDWGKDDDSYHLDHEYLIVENAPNKYNGYDHSAGHYSEMVFDPSTNDIFLANGFFNQGGFFWQIEYTISGKIESKSFTNAISNSYVRKYSIVEELDVDGKELSHNSGYFSYSGTLFNYNIDDKKLRFTTILDYFTNNDRIYYSLLAEPKDRIVSEENRIMMCVEGSLWDIDLDTGDFNQEIFWYYDEDSEFHRKRSMLNLYQKENEISVLLCNNSIIYDLENGTRIFANTSIPKFHRFDVGPISGHYYFRSNKTGEIIEYDPETGDTWNHVYNVSDPDTGNMSKLRNFCVNSDETVAIICTLFNITILDLETGKLSDENYCENSDYYSNGVFFCEVFYHEESNLFVGVDENFRVYDILGRRKIGELDRTTHPDFEKSTNCTIYSVTGTTYFYGAGEIGYSSEGLNGLVSFDPCSCEYECYTENIGLPGINCMGLALNEERDLIIIAGEEYIAAVRIEDLENEPEKKEITVNEVLSRTHPIPDELLGIDPKDKIEIHENVYVIGAVGFGTLSLIGISIILFEPLKFKILSLIVFPLFSKVKEEEVLGNRKRKDIYDLIRRHPHIHLNAIRKQLSLSPGEAVYHLRVLEREDRIRSESRGVKKIFFITGAKRGRDEFNRSGLQKMIIDIISREPGISQREISRRLNRAPSTINYNVRFLAREKIIRIERIGKRSICFNLE